MTAPPHHPAKSTSSSSCLHQGERDLNPQMAEERIAEWAGLQPCSFSDEPTRIRIMTLNHEALRLMRRAAGLSRKEVAAAAGISLATLSRLENGWRDPQPTVDTLLRLCDLYHIVDPRDVVEYKDAA